MCSISFTRSRNFHLSPGVGIGLVTILLPVIIGEHFGQKRTAAVGLSYAGATLGAFAFPMVFKWLLEQFALWNALLLMGTISLNALPAVLVLKSRGRSYEPVPSPDDHASAVMDGHACERSITERRSSARGDGDNHNRDADKQSNEKIAAIEKRSESEANGNSAALEVAVKIDVRKKDTKDTRVDCESECDESSTATTEAGRIWPDTGSRRSVHNESAENGKVDVNGSTRSASTIGGKIERAALLNEAERETTMSLIKANAAAAPMTKTKTKSWRRALADHVSTDARLLRSPYFALISFTYVAYIVCNVTLLLILVDYAIDCGVHENRAVLLLSMYSVTDLIGRLLPGWLSWANITSNKTLYIVSIGGLGGIFFAFPLSMANKPPPDTSFHILLALTLASGFFAGCQMILPPVVTGNKAARAACPT